VETIVRGLVDDPDAVEVEEHAEGDSRRYDVRVAPDDRGNVIGRQGATANALRTVVSGVARRRGLRVEIEIVD
jgi:predicted RNA-binding protein YlqC (UPF0109 family)